MKLKMLFAMVFVFIFSNLAFADNSNSNGQVSYDDSTKIGLNGGGHGGTTGGTTGGNLGCTFTQGYWGSSPAGQAQLIVLIGVGTLSLGNSNYTAAQLNSILDTPAGGNALLILADQLIAAKLNILNGADGSAVSGDISGAETLIGNLLIPPIGTDVINPSSTLGQQMTSVGGTLDSYNNGQLNVPHCN